ncbi:ion transporter [Erythrobacter mangrovi]|uniref:Ion transporter n=1 Tax=Erythrobacter mangrovi TaxID=2739433 RepID=A0A7D3XS80_9SPHN|nr:ion transporter [Erythrobacter mangrovi]QKG72394.1 ion transporter [Erythrobacter mangrovi]
MAGLRSTLHHQLFVGAELDGHLTVLNRLLIVTIILAVASAALSTEPTIPKGWHNVLVIGELVFGVIFLLEYIARIYAAAEEPGEESSWSKRWRFIRSPIGLIDLIVVISTLVPLVTADAAMLRTVRLLRVVAVMKFGRFSRAITEVWAAVANRVDDLIVTAALAFVFILLGATALYMTEGHIHPEAFGSIPRSLWWAVMTFTTVGYGDVYPVTGLGKVFASIMALAGVAFVAMPTGIIAAAFSEAMQRRRDQKIEDMRRHLARLDEVDEEVEAKIAALERANKPHP